jgi:exodeoxyribonuclease VII large subunit
VENQQYISVSTLSKYIKRKFDADPHLENVFVKGEISNLKKHSSGHVYFTLKDESAIINAVMFRPQFQKVKFQVENGMKVLLEGQVTIYEKTGGTQIYVKKLLVDGIGDLFVAFQQMKERLESEGLFSHLHKKSIPLFPQKIGMITSQTGAAIRDMVTTIKRRFPIAKIILYPAVVQGTQGGDSIVKAIQKANQNTSIDVLIVGRGGGSIEDLWNFNEEKVARAIFQSEIPIISAVGHETDITIADYVADLRAPTPTGAAEMATPDLTELLLKIQGYQTKILKYAKTNIRNDQNRLQALERSFAFRSPQQLFQQKAQNVDLLMDRLNHELDKLIVLHKNQLKVSFTKLNHFSPKFKIQLGKQDLAQVHDRLVREADVFVQKKRQKFQQQIAVLRAVDPLAIMERGYSVTFNIKKETIKSIQQVAANDIISINVNDGFIDCRVEETRRNVSHDKL